MRVRGCSRIGGRTNAGRADGLNRSPPMSVARVAGDAVTAMSVIGRGGAFRFSSTNRAQK